jgi:hypothetical protein
MSRITVDAAMASKLAQADQVIELCDPAGRILGRFHPLADMSDWEPMSPEATAEELDRREKAGEKRYTTSEMLAHLKGVEQK